MKQIIIKEIILNANLSLIYQWGESGLNRLSAVQALIADCKLNSVCVCMCMQVYV